MLNGNIDRRDPRFPRRGWEGEFAFLQVRGVGSECRGKGKVAIRGKLGNWEGE